MHGLDSFIVSRFKVSFLVKKKKTNKQTNKKKQKLASGKLGLTLRPKGGGWVFTVPKPGKSSYREVWHGRQVSLASRKPPKPRHLASPTALTYLMALPGRPVRMSKRDAKCWFDQLRAPRQLRPWFARPPVSIDMLLSSGLVSEDLVCAVP